MYVLVLVSVCSTAWLASWTPLLFQKKVTSFLLAIITIFSALRGYVGTDTYSYHEMYNNFVDEDLGGVFGVVEPIFVFLIKAVGLLGGSSFLFVGAISLIQGVLLWVVLRSLASPALFLCFYVSAFYLSFSFNILRGGTAALVLLITVSELYGSAKKFYIGGLIAFLAHYSSLIFYLPIVIVRERISFKLFGLLVVILVASGLVFVFLISDAQAAKYLSYAVFFGSGEEASYGAGFFLLIVLFGILCSYISLSFGNAWIFVFFLFWVVLRYFSNVFLFVDRVEVIVNIILVYWCFYYSGRRKYSMYVRMIVLPLVVLNLFGGISGLEKVDSGARVNSLDDMHLKSPYVPYRFFWEE
ncbi:EpsG family protein [Leptothrix ochracea]|uniref:EpsG family protein n=1 Tax=Leptothrix ochracea TaxID=735331 RepID=UPI00155AAE27|nr:EpsG family protein [Leptothrix ochracea]